MWRSVWSPRLSLPTCSPRTQLVMYKLSPESVVWQPAWWPNFGSVVLKNLYVPILRFFCFLFFFRGARMRAPRTKKYSRCDALGPPGAAERVPASSAFSLRTSSSACQRAARSPYERALARRPASHTRSCRRCRSLGRALLLGLHARGGLAPLRDPHLRAQESPPRLDVRDVSVISVCGVHVLAELLICSTFLRV